MTQTALDKLDAGDSLDGHVLAKSLVLRRIGVECWKENVCYVHRSFLRVTADDELEFRKVEVRASERRVCASVHFVSDERLVGHGEVALGPRAFDQLGVSEGERVTLVRQDRPRSMPALRSKIRGVELSEAQIDRLVDDMHAERYFRSELIAFMVAAQTMSPSEVCALTRARARHAERFQWQESLVLDKHSLGGVVAGCVSMIVIPIVAAHGLLIPKTSSRAITSAAGTADVMECVARVDLGREQARTVLRRARGCVLWNGNLTCSPIDEQVNSIIAPLQIRSEYWAIASILSKKLGAGSSHVLIDVPYGGLAKAASRGDAELLGGLFMEIGSRVGLQVRPVATQATEPIGRGVGPALECRDVIQVLENAPNASTRLRAKALDCAGAMLDWDLELAGGGRERAEELLRSGSALRAFQEIVDSQGRHAAPATIGPHAREVVAERSGQVQAVDARRIAMIARLAGAPLDKSAGVDLLASSGRSVREGRPLYLIYSRRHEDLDRAFEAATQDCGFNIV